jgi:putative two-component system hydrogenase maturation factor HypX/HoxX
MRILMITHSFNSLAQSLYLELTRRGHDISIEFDINDEVTEEAVSLFNPALIIAPYLRRAIAENVWKRVPCFIVHPGIPGDRGPSSLDWAILENESEWGVTVLQATSEMDAGDIWASQTFPMRLASKSSIYRQEVTMAAVTAVLQAVARFEAGDYTPVRLDYSKPEIKGRLRPLMRQSDRAIDWQKDTSETIIRKIQASDGFPGVLDQIGGENFFLFNAFKHQPFSETSALNSATETSYPQTRTPDISDPGTVIAWSEAGIQRSTFDGKSVWIGHLRRQVTGEASAALKLPAHLVLAEQLKTIPRIDFEKDIFYEEKNGVGYLHFEFHNGAMSTEQCRNLQRAISTALKKDIRVLVLLGGRDFWSNGIHLHRIENSPSPADESWNNIQAMNDLTLEILKATQVLTISALQGNAGAGGVFLALAADHVFARTGIVLNPHYKSMGNLFGSEYWTYSLPRKVGSEEKAKTITEQRLPLGTTEAKAMGLIEDFFGSKSEDFILQIKAAAEKLATSPDYLKLIEKKCQARQLAEAKKPLETYRAAEMEQMNLNFFGFDPSYHVARYNFVYRTPHSRTPRHLAKHRFKEPGVPWK